MTNTKYMFMGIAVAAAIALFASSSATMVLAQQTGNMTAGGGGDLIKKLMAASVKAKALKTIINNKDVFVVVCDPDTTNPGTNCKVFSLSPQE